MEILGDAGAASDALVEKFFHDVKLHHRQRFGYDDAVRRAAPTRRDPREDVLDEVEGARGTTVEDRARILEALCRMAAEQIAQHVRPALALAWQDPVAPEAEMTLARLRARYRGHGRAA